MDKQVIETGESPTIWIMTHGNLKLKGSDDLGVTVASESPEDLNISREGETIKITSHSDLTARVPRESRVTVDTVHGNAVIKGLDMPLQIKNVYGNLQLRSTSAVSIHRVDGEVTGKHFDDDLNIETIMGNLVLRDFEGLQIANRIDGNIVLADFSGSVSFKTSGNATIRMDPQPGETYSFSADGNLLIRMPEDASATLRIERADGGLQIKVGGTRITEKQRFPFESVLGDGDSVINMRSSGNVSIIGRAPDWEMSEDFDADLGEEFEGMVDEISEQAVQQVEAQLEMLERHLNAQMENLSQGISGMGLAADQAERLSQRAREASERATARAHEKMQRAQERIRRKIEAAQRKAEIRANKAERRYAPERRGWDFNAPPRPPEPPSDPVTDEERLVILRMLQEGKITSEQADSLLAALEGKES